MPNEIKAIVGNHTDTVNLKKSRARNSSVSFVNVDSIPLNLFLYAPDGVDFTSGQKLIASLLNKSVSDRQKAFAIWRLCAASGFHYEFPYSSNLPDNMQPRSLVNFPYFMCGEKAGILSNLAKMAGIQSRIISLDGHVVAELFYDNDWHMFDADEDIVFLDKDHEVLSVKELASAPFLHIRKKNALLLSGNDFHGYKNYRQYLKMYLSNDTLSRISYPKMADSINWSTSVYLNNYDTLVFKWSKTPESIKIAQSKFKYYTEGIVKRNLFPYAQVARVADSVFIFSEEIPYYIKRVTVRSTDTIAKFEFMAVNRITGDSVIVPFKERTKKNYPTIAFDAPKGEQIYYKYQIKITGLAYEQVERLSVNTYFEFNSLVFPLIQQKKAVIESVSAKDK